jgi:hypothetical protein
MKLLFVRVGTYKEHMSQNQNNLTEENHGSDLIWQIKSAGFSHNFCTSCSVLKTLGKLEQYFR